jgi:hypothetical protein
MVNDAAWDSRKDFSNTASKRRHYLYRAIMMRVLKNLRRVSTILSLWCLVLSFETEALAQRTCVPAKYTSRLHFVLVNGSLAEDSFFHR